MVQCSSSYGLRHRIAHVLKHVGHLLELVSPVRLWPAARPATLICQQENKSVNFKGRPEVLLFPAGQGESISWV